MALTNPFGWTRQAGGAAISTSAISNVLTMTGVGSTIRFQEDAKAYFPSTDPSTWNFSILDTTISLCNAAGLPVIIPIQNLDKSMTTPGTGVCQGKDFPIPSYLTQIATTLATRYNGQAVSYECLNELASDGNADCNLAYTASPTGVVTCMQAVYQAVKAVNPNISVGAPALLKISQGIPWIIQWLSNIFRNGGGQWTDYLNLHYYPGTNAALPTLRQLWQTFRDVARAYGYPNLKMRITEYGWPTGSVTEQQQNDLTLGVLEEIQNSDGFIEMACYYTVSGSDGYSPYHTSGGVQTNKKLYSGFQQAKLLYPVWPAQTRNGTVVGASGNASVIGSSGTGNMAGSSGKGTLIGASGNDTIIGSSGSGKVIGKANN